MASIEGLKTKAKDLTKLARHGAPVLGAIMSLQIEAQKLPDNTPGKFEIIAEAALAMKAFQDAQGAMERNSYLCDAADAALSKEAAERAKQKRLKELDEEIAEPLKFLAENTEWLDTLTSSVSNALNWDIENTTDTVKFVNNWKKLEGLKYLYSAILEDSEGNIAEMKANALKRASLEGIVSENFDDLKQKIDGIGGEERERSATCAFVGRVQAEIEGHQNMELRYAALEAKSTLAKARAEKLGIPDLSSEDRKLAVRDVAGVELSQHQQEIVAQSMINIDAYTLNNEIKKAENVVLLNEIDEINQKKCDIYNKHLKIEAKNPQEFLLKLHEKMKDPQIGDDSDIIDLYNDLKVNYPETLKASQPIDGSDSSVTQNMTRIDPQAATAVPPPVTLSQIKASTATQKNLEQQR